MNTPDIVAAVAAADVPGLRILQVRDSFYWQFRRNRKAHGLGCYPAVSPETARARAQLLAERPAAAHAVAGAPILQPSPSPPSSLKTFLQAAHEHLATRDHLRAPTRRKHLAMLELLAPLHDRHIAELTTPDFVRVLEEIQNKGDRRETAHRCAMVATWVCRYAMNKGYTRHNAMPKGQLEGTLKPVKVTHHAAILDPVRFGQLLHFIRDYRLFGRSASVAAALRLAPLVAVRRGELDSAAWADIDLDKAEWLIPAERTKMNKPLLVPLSRQAVEILREQRRVTGAGKYVFATDWRDRPLSNGTLGQALKAFCSGEEHQPHGFRSSASTMLNERGYDSELIELQLGHSKRDRVRGIYDRSQRLPERRAMLQAWSDLCDEMRAAAVASPERPAAAVKPIPSPLSTCTDNLDTSDCDDDLLWEERAMRAG